MSGWPLVMVLIPAEGREAVTKVRLPQNLKRLIRNDIF